AATGITSAKTSTGLTATWLAPTWLASTSASLRPHHRTAHLRGPHLRSALLHLRRLRWLLLRRRTIILWIVAPALALGTVVGPGAAEAVIPISIASIEPVAISVVGLIAVFPAIVCAPIIHNGGANPHGLAIARL